MKWLSLSKPEAETLFSSWATIPEPDFDSTCDKIRTEILNLFNNTMVELSITETEIGKKGYQFDLLFGLRLYELLKNNYEMNLRTATDDGIWRYLSMRVAPDLVYHRWGLKPERYWSKGRRIWFKTMWWYIHLSHQGTIDKTYQALKYNTADEVVQLVERAGSHGYRVDLYREIMKQYAPVAIMNKESSFIFRKVMKLNTARCKMIEPGLVPGGLETYVRELFNYFDTKPKKVSAGN